MSTVATFHGKREAEVDIAAVRVQVSQGEFLMHNLFVVTGPEPSFTFGCAHQDVIRTARDFPGHPKDKYQWIFPEQKADVVGHEPDDVYGVTLLFVGGNTYRYVLERYSAAGMLLETVRDVRVSSTNPENVWPETVDVFFS